MTIIQVREARSFEPEQPVLIEHADMLLIRRVACEIGKIEAIRVTRWLTTRSLKASKDFVEGLGPK